MAPILPQEIYEAGVLELKDVIAPSALKISPRELSLGDKIVRTFFVISYPRFLSEAGSRPSSTSTKSSTSPFSSIR